MANIHQLGLGLIKLVANSVERDNNVELWEDLEPHARDMISEIFPNANIDVHHLVNLGYQVFEKCQNNRQNKLIEQARIEQQKLLTSPTIIEQKEKEKTINDIRRRGYNNI